jgi:hypothetical protein
MILQNTFLLNLTKKLAIAYATVGAEGGGAVFPQTF